MGQQMVGRVCLFFARSAVLSWWTAAVCSKNLTLCTYGAPCGSSSSTTIRLPGLVLVPNAGRVEAYASSTNPPLVHAYSLSRLWSFHQIFPYFFFSTERLTVSIFFFFNFFYHFII